MYLAIVLVGLFAILFLIHQKKDWFVVEQRRIIDDELGNRINNSITMFLGFGRDEIKGFKVSVDKDTKYSFIISYNGSNVIRVDQMVFDNVDAALLFFERLVRVNTHNNYLDNYVLVRRIVAKYRRKAITIPPKKYISKDGEILKFWPEAWDKQSAYSPPRKNELRR